MHVMARAMCVSGLHQYGLVLLCRFALQLRYAAIRCGTPRSEQRSRFRTTGMVQVPEVGDVAWKMPQELQHARWRGW